MGTYTAASSSERENTVHSSGPEGYFRNKYCGVGKCYDGQPILCCIAIGIFGEVEKGAILR